ncbi:bifunctional UDP-3-O-[3-hydroxymyristoyl] N-acetylglucosamine deacetylase/3-hydroxyacyl-ACP dehydratase [Kamptonema cortianum]|nr:bifunctional UDP-3-O-[3-hydroxymyristoyl] N-acetylglucosamine deacetylase/3-hydroxyacyl-ACP dehydratase [Oscillatoria laete-virens]MDK3159918.1 bifunctional UDP-3-O-[3-hydroxymyristoyl] N-acetylglucosamine deacetylase/3-hydroxyacyl-ACP dehydratase [Kamptonema cortianum]MDL5050513.1 bifunctional UDP-3-O-[3-hydroxymyristoyl] N-acetylglucosamine deacetylase/3-hydroxyacyl-ACP dehydratase [Oscillatoria amoena NRMC-F 0135]MDL5055525.1 bifunctional UDP-3-O-[3-hydroxymyristoyl] N-acetylglucosamine de
MSKFQKTLAKSVSLSGSALHTGNKVNLTFHPAPENHGFKFKRTDLTDQPVLDAHVDLVKQVERATTIADGAIKIHTIEHVLSSLTGMGVDNCLIEMDSNEPPICEGSAREYVRMINEAGIVEQTAPCNFFTLREPIHIFGKDGAMILAVPDEEFKVSCTNANHTGFFTQYLSETITPKTYETQIAPARTFVFYEEVQKLMESGLIKGGSLENAVVIRGQSVLSKEPLRFPDEFVRHKILDIVGDLSLIGRRLRAHIIAVKPGHGLNVEMARAIYKQYLKYFGGTRFDDVRKPIMEGTLDIGDILKIMPHRYPFLLIDRILKFEGENKATGLKQVTINEPFFQGHFPRHPVMPGVLQVEAMAQVASILLLRNPDNQGKIGFFMSCDNVKFRKPVVPGDSLIIECEMTRSRGKIGKATAKCYVNHEVVSEGDLMFTVVDS